MEEIERVLDGEGTNSGSLTNLQTILNPHITKFPMNLYSAYLLQPHP